MADSSKARSKVRDRCQTKTWLESFLTKQLVIAHAKAMGYSDHPDVTRILALMERYMLTQPEGPFYKTFNFDGSICEERLEALYKDCSTVVDAVIARFNDEATATEALGKDFDKLDNGEKLRRIEQCRERDGAFVVSGRLCWPFVPFFELTERLGGSRPDQWIEAREAPFGISHCYVRNIRTYPRPDFSVERPQFASEVRLIDKQKFQWRRRVELLSAAAFQFDATVGRQIMEQVRALPPSSSEIPESLLGAIKNESLFHYEIGDQQITVTVETFRRHFNDRMMRQLPIDLQRVRSNAEDMAVEELDLRAARAQRVHEDPQFVEDKQGFRDMQVLDYFEKERLLPSLEIPASEFEQYYLENAARFTRSIRVQGRLLTFKNEDQLLAWQQTSSSNVAAGDTLELSADGSWDSLPEFADFNEILMQAPLGFQLGPVQRGSGYIVFIKEKNLETSPLRLAEARALIQPELERLHLDEMELRLANELVEQFNIEDTIDYGRYGLTAVEVRTPWRQ